MGLAILNEGGDLTDVYMKTQFGNPCEYIKETLSPSEVIHCAETINSHFKLVENKLTYQKKKYIGFE